MLLRMITALLLVPLPAAAQIAPDALWRSWQDPGYPRAEAEDVSRGDGTLRLRGLTLHLAEGLSLRTDTATLAPRGEAVVIRPAETLALAYDTASGAPIPVDIEAPGARIRVSGDIAAPAYALEAETLAARSDRLLTTLVFADLTVSYAADDTSEDLDIEAARLEAASTIPTEAGELEIDAEIDTVRGVADLPTAREATVTVEGETSRWSYATSGTAREVRGTTTTDALRHRVILSRAGLAHESTTRNLRLDAQGPEVPLTEARARIARLETSATGPLPDTEGPQPASVEIDVRSMTASEQVWDVIDPGRALPRDPVDLSLAAEGRLEAARGEIRPVSMTLTDLSAEGLGTTLSAEGDAIFEQDDRGGVRPVGRFDIRTTGASELLTTLANIGALAPTEAIGARIALMTLSEAQDGDVRTTTLGFAPDGTVTLNDQTVADLTPE